MTSKTTTGRKLQPETFRKMNQCLFCGYADYENGTGRCENCKDIEYNHCEICEVVLREGLYKFYSYDIKDDFRNWTDMKTSKNEVREFMATQSYDKLQSKELCNKCIDWKDRMKEVCVKCDNDFYNNKEYYKSYGNVCGHCVIIRNKNISMSKMGENFEDLNVDEPVIEYQFDSKNHIHKYIDKPLMGTSTIVGVLAKPLTWWASGLAVGKLGWVNAKKRIDGKYKVIHSEEERRDIAGKKLAEIKGYDNKEYLALLDEAYKAHSVKLDDTAQAGTDLHEELERFVKNHMDGEFVDKVGYDEIIHPFIDWTMREVKKFLWSELHCFSTRLWVGGISDCGVELKNGTTGIIDFKSSKDSYDSQFIQIGGYDIQISENGGYNKDGYKIYTPEKSIDFYAVIPFGAPEFKVDFRYNTEELRSGFEACVNLYKLTNN